MKSMEFKIPHVTPHPNYRMWCKINKRVIKLIISHLRTAYETFRDDDMEDFDEKEERFVLFLAFNESILN